tara:strand:+ start:194 stop:355 length:162 start_codon:yes stop_codon:yes gene_type:complete
MKVTSQFFRIPTEKAYKIDALESTGEFGKLGSPSFRMCIETSSKLQRSLLLEQ